MSAKSSQAHRVAVIGGDGIGPEVTTEALKVVRAAGIDLETTTFDLGGARYLRDGEVLSDATLAELRKFAAYMMAKPSGWRFCASRMAKEMGCGERHAKACVSELIKAKVLERSSRNHD